MTRADVAALKHGLYRLRWKEGGRYSVAAVGSDYDGNRWYAPTNWIGGIPCFDWSKVKAAFPIVEAR